MNIMLFVPCLVDQFHPEIAESAARVLTRAGCRIRYPSGQTCCGQPLYKAGHADQARELAEHWLALFQGAEAVVAPSGSCVSMVRKVYPQLFADDPDMLAKARNAAERTYEFTEFLVNALGVTDVGARMNVTAVYHDSCQVGRSLGIHSQPLELMRNVKDLKLVQMSRPEACCGFGGTFSLQFPDLSTAIAEDKLADIEASGAEVAVTAEPSCLMNLDSMARHEESNVRVMHIAQLLDSGRSS